MTLNKNTKILIVGLGLIGGSYAQALSEKGFEVGAIDTNANALDFALAKGYIAHGKTVVEKEYVESFDVVVFALYPHTLIEWLEKHVGFIKKGALLTDVTGVKGSVVYKAQSIVGNRAEFVSAHPMAGREVGGVENADARIFEGANYIVVPTNDNTAEGIAECKELGRLLGFKTICELSPEEHDEIVGFLSHLTHCIAVSLMVCKDSERLADYTGDSFRDLTRIAKINDEMWSELLLANKEELLSQMELFEKHFDELKSLIASDNREKIRQMMRLSTQKRKAFDKSKENI